MRRILLPLLVFCALIPTAKSQQPTSSQPPAYGTVTGHVICADTNGPARLAKVSLRLAKASDPSKHTTETIRGYQTSLDGSFVMQNVLPGQYFVFVEALGYLSPTSYLNYSDSYNMTPEIVARMMGVVPTVTVSAHGVANVDVRLERGAQLSGTIRYDDGSPYAGAYVNAMTRKQDGGHAIWMAVPAGALQTADVTGHYHLAGLPPGEYIVATGLQTGETTTISNGQSVSSSGGRQYYLSFYSGDVTEESKATRIKLGANEQHDGADITIPIRKLHTVTGSLLDARGHPINMGFLQLLGKDLRPVARAQVNMDDSTFRFDFVPEGEYTLSVMAARDVAREELPAQPHVFSVPQFKDTTLREYGEATEPLIVRGDITNLSITVPPKPVKTAEAQ